MSLADGWSVRPSGTRAQVGRGSLCLPSSPVRAGSAAPTAQPRSCLEHWWTGTLVMDEETNEDEGAAASVAGVSMRAAARRSPHGKRRVSVSLFLVVALSLPPRQPGRSCPFTRCQLAVAAFLLCARTHWPVYSPACARTSAIWHAPRQPTARRLELLEKEARIDQDRILSNTAVAVL